MYPMKLFMGEVAVQFNLNLGTRCRGGGGRWPALCSRCFTSKEGHPGTRKNFDGPQKKSGRVAEERNLY